MEAQRALVTVMRWGKMLGIVVREIASSRFPLNDKLAILDAVLEPIETHVYGFGALLFDSVIEDAPGHAVVGGDDSGGLGPSHFAESDSEWNSSLGIEEGGAGLGLSCGTEDIAHDACENMEGPIEGWGEAFEVVGMGTEKEKARGAGAGLGL